ncbi:MAG: hypothetical protein AAF564_03850 [Bacteroidota bacterium]
MQEVFKPLEIADYHFLIGIIESPFNLTDDQKLKSLLAAYEKDETPARRAALNKQLERSTRYLGSSDLAYFMRRWATPEPGVPFHEMMRDVAGALKVDKPQVGTQREMLEQIVTQYATKQFAELPDEEKQKMLESLGVEQERAASFIKKSAGVFALPMLIEAFGSLVVNGLIKNIIFGLIGKIIGHQLAMRLFNFILGRFPWWVSWIGPVAWTVSIGWTAFDVQGPAYRKTIPIVLYLGLCSMRGKEDGSATPRKK